MTTESSPGLRYWREMTSKKEFYGSDYWTGEKARQWGGRDYLDGVPQQMITEVVKRYFLPLGGTALEVGAAFGYLVRNLRAAGIAARGIDISPHCLQHAAAAARPFLQYGSVLQLPYPDNSFDLVICMEVLEHLPPELVSQGIAELARVAKKNILASVPSYGPNEYGPYGLPFHTYPENPGWWRDAVANVPFTDLDIDERTGEPRCGHLTHATYRWWTEQFRRQHLARQGALERRIYDDPDLDVRAWQLYCLAPGVKPEPIPFPAVAGWGDTVQLDGRELRWCGTGEVVVKCKNDPHPASSIQHPASSIQLTIFTGPRRLTSPYTVMVAAGAYSFVPGQIVRVTVPAQRTGNTLSVIAGAGPVWSDRALFDWYRGSPDVRGGWGLLSAVPAAAARPQYEKVADADWAPALPSDPTVPHERGLWGRIRHFLSER